MASIQQSMNALVGSALGAVGTSTYFIRQSPGYQAKQLEKGVDKVNKQFGLHGDKTIEQATPEERARMLQAGERGMELREKAFEMAPTAKRLENITKAESSLKTLKQGINEAAAQEAEQEIIDQQRQEAAEAYTMEENAFESSISQKEKAENNAVSRLERRSMTAREMLASLAERKDLLSAKERGQLTTMMGRNKEKGGIDK